MEGTQEYKSISPAAQRYLERLIIARDALQSQIDSFGAYLADEVGVAKQDGWLNLDPKLGFFRTVEPSDKRNQSAEKVATQPATALADE